jgi:hypothetical protein
MLSISETGRPEIICGRCQNEILPGEALVIWNPDHKAVVFTCIDCTEIVKQKIPRLECFMAEDFFRSILDPKRPILR